MIVAGKFKVIGMFRLAGRGLVVYGDVIEGSVAANEKLLIPLNSSFSMSAEIRSVEMTDGTPTGSHVALLFTAEDELELELIEAMNFAGETLDVCEP